MHLEYLSLINYKNFEADQYEFDSSINCLVGRNGAGKTTILDAKPVEEGFIVGKYDDPLMYAAVPIAGSNTKLAVIHQANVLKVCRNRQSAVNFVNKHSKGKSVAKLPI